MFSQVYGNMKSISVFIFLYPVVVRGGGGGGGGGD